MKKADALRYKVVTSKDLAPIATAVDPANANRLPIGTELNAEPDLRYVPATGNMEKDWQGVIFSDKDENAYATSPRTLLGYAWVDGKFVQVVAQPFPKKALVDILKAGLTVRVVRFDSVETDVFGSTTGEKVTRDMPVFEIVKKDKAPKASKADKE